MAKATRKQLGLTFKRLTKVKPEKFTDANIVYCQQFPNYMSTVSMRKVKMFDEAGIDLSDCNPVYGHGPRGQKAVEITRGKKKLPGH